jgi:hypothetical protein
MKHTEYYFYCFVIFQQEIKWILKYCYTENELDLKQYLKGYKYIDLHHNCI